MTEEEEMEFSRAEALAEYGAYKTQKQREEEQEECSHDEHDHGICLNCGKDIFDDLVGRADFLRDSIRDQMVDSR
jgi:hypothetical protein